MSTTSSSSSQKQKHNSYVFIIDCQRTITISSDFDSGNIALVRQVNELYYILEAVGDFDVNPPTSRKTWFHFKVSASKGIKVRMIIENVTIYDTIFEERLACRAMHKEGIHGEWKEATESFLTFRNEIVLVIDHTFRSSVDVYFCITVPFSFSENEHYLAGLPKHIHPTIHYTDEILTYSVGKRPVHLLTITDKSNMLLMKQPIVLITARVHPGQTSSSFCLQGMLELLLHPTSLQAYLLRRMFIFLIVPMINPDGVYEGNYRMDKNGVNLNRVYAQCKKYPVIYEIITLIKKVMEKGRIQFYFDLHSHSTLKNSFIYGNAFEDIVLQTCSELFCKVLEENCKTFSYSLSCFDEKHMKLKDKGQPLSKEGCGRVVISKTAKVIRSYTLQSSILYEGYNYQRPQLEMTNPQFTIETGSIRYGHAKQHQKKHNKGLVQVNREFGWAVMVTILDVFRKNPYTRIQQQSLQNYSRQIALKLLQCQQRFKLMDTRAYSKAKYIQKLIKDLEQPIETLWQSMRLHRLFFDHAWPAEMRIPDGMKEQHEKRLMRVKTYSNGQRSNTNLMPVRSYRRDIVNGTKLEPRAVSKESKDEPTLKMSVPEIKYSFEIQSPQKQVISLQPLEQKKKHIILGLLQTQITHTPHTHDQTALKRSNVSLNRLSALSNQPRYSPIFNNQSQQSKNLAIHASSKQLFADSKKQRIATECCIDQQPQFTIHKQDLLLQRDEDHRHSQKKVDMNRKKLPPSVRITETIRKLQRGSVKLPQIHKLMIDTTKLRTRNDVKQAELIAMVPESPNEEVRREMDQQDG